MREVEFRVRENEQIARDVYRMILDGDTSDITTPGQFINIKLRNHYLRRPISVCDWDDESITIIYKIIGEGTHDMSTMKPGERLSALSGLGNGYNLCDNAQGMRRVIVGGGVGVPPLYGLAKRLVKNGIMPDVILGFNTREDCFYYDEFSALGLSVKVTTLDGSFGIKGVVTDAMDGQRYTYACGPVPMLRTVHERVSDGQFSFEARMACGFGACMGCSIRTKDGYKLVCKDGPVLKHSDIIW